MLNTVNSLREMLHHVYSPEIAVLRILQHCAHQVASSVSEAVAQLHVHQPLPAGLLVIQSLFFSQRLS